jgi:hypothetical protein
MNGKTARTLAIPFLATALVAGAQDYATHTGAELFATQAAIRRHSMTRVPA